VEVQVPRHREAAAAGRRDADGGDPAVGDEDVAGHVLPVDEGGPHAEPSGT
jgi:hypothetical protein